MLTEQQLVKIYPTLANKPARLAEHFKHLVAAMQEGEINTPLRMAAYLAQIGHESHELRYMSEVWGPTDQQKKYERPAGAKLVTDPKAAKPLWQKLGNTEPGDGYRFRGAGPIQLTGRANFRAAGKALSLDLENRPDQAFTAPVGHRLGVYFWTSRNLNALADAKNFDAITLKINGGYNGKAERDRLYALACKVLGA